MEVDEKRQRVSLSMRLDEAPGVGSRSSAVRTDVNVGAAPASRNRRPPEPPRATAHAKPTPGGAIALALERAKQKK
ncbi:MAG: hypothetical protein E6J73_07535 [Deltaproteobacteria bacterium]|nr:MAG: hypothetical protein E6J73_07535 [Deltaproteobacteria bacterium]